MIMRPLCEVVNCFASINHVHFFCGQGVKPETIQWIVPNDCWYLNRDAIVKDGGMQVAKNIWNEKKGCENIRRTTCTKAKRKDDLRQEQNHRRWRYQRRLLDYQSPLFQLEFPFDYLRLGDHRIPLDH